VRRRLRPWRGVIVAAVLLWAAGMAVFLLVINDADEGEAPDPAGATRTTAELTPAEAEVADLVQEAAETRNADDCARLATPNYVLQRERLQGISLAACQDDVFDQDEGLLDEPIEVVDVVGLKKTLTGLNAMVVVAHAAGSDWAGLTARIRIKSDKLAAIEGFDDPDRAALEHAIRVTLVEGPPALPKEVADCAVESLRASPDTALEAALLDTSSRALYLPVLACDRRALIDQAMADVPERFPFLPAAAIDCAATQAETFGGAQLLQFVLLRDERPALAAALDCDRRGALVRYAAQLQEGPYKLPKRVVPCVVGRLNAKPTAELVAVFTTKGVDEITATCGYKPPQG
jgi:hypothetical protein